LDQFAASERESLIARNEPDGLNDMHKPITITLSLRCFVSICAMSLCPECADHERCAGCWPAG
jgi:hypothetical protein